MRLDLRWPKLLPACINGKLVHAKCPPMPYCASMVLHIHHASKPPASPYLAHSFLMAGAIQLELELNGCDTCWPVRLCIGNQQHEQVLIKKLRNRLQAWGRRGVGG